MDFNGPKEFDDPQLFDDPQVFDDQLEVWTLIIEKSTVIPSSPMVLFYVRSSLRQRLKIPGTKNTLNRLASIGL